MSTTMRATVTTIGTLLPAPLTCSDTTHIAGVYNPNSDDTYCRCGVKRWPGKVGTWHSIPRRPVATNFTPSGRPIELAVFGYDTYFLHTQECPGRAESVDVPLTHLCGVQDEARVCRCGGLIEADAEFDPDCPEPHCDACIVNCMPCTRDLANL